MKGNKIEHTDKPKPGDYWRAPTGWGCITPSGHTVNLDRHTVTENPDGTITVSPAITVREGKEEVFHGILENGVWK
jgi:hypothetical protein